MTSFVRESKFRNVQVSLNPKQNYEQLRIANIATDGNLLTSNSNFLAYIDNSAGGNRYIFLTVIKSF